MSSLLEVMVKEALQEFEEKFCNLLACFQAEQVYRSMTALATLEFGGLPKSILDDLDRGDTKSHMKFMCEIFLKLLHRGALNAFQVINPLTAEADAELDSLEIVSGEKAAPPKVDPKKEQQDQLAEAVQAYRTLSSGQFKLYWLNVPAKRALFEQACAKGLV